MAHYCEGCRRPADRCACDDPAEPRASRAPEGHIAVDPLFHEAAKSGFEPLSDTEREAFREKAEAFRKVVER